VAFRDTLETVKMKLPLERFVLALFKVERDDLLHELISLLHAKSFATWKPGYNEVSTRLLDFLKHFTIDMMKKI
jgi:hypothetical protein